MTNCPEGGLEGPENGYIQEMNQCIDYNTAFGAEGGAQWLRAKPSSIQVCSVWFTVLLKSKLLFINKSANG